MLNAKQFFYAMVVTTILGFVGIIAAFYWGEGLLNNRASLIADLKTDRDLAGDKIIALRKAQKSTTRSEEATRILNVLLPSTKSQETLIADILYTATLESGIPSSNISALTFSNSGNPSDLSGTEPFKEVSGVLSYPFNMTVQDITYDTLLKLLREIETNGRLVQVDDIQISPSKTTPGSISSVNLTLKAFLKP
jgi:Tfp pilus assembly protein PilO